MTKRVLELDKPVSSLNFAHWLRALCQCSVFSNFRFLASNDNGCCLSVTVRTEQVMHLHVFADALFGISLFSS